MPREAGGPPAGGRGGRPEGPTLELAAPLGGAGLGALGPFSPYPARASRARLRTTAASPFIPQIAHPSTSTSPIIASRTVVAVALLWLCLELTVAAEGGATGRGSGLSCGLGKCDVTLAWNWPCLAGPRMWSPPPGPGRGTDHRLRVGFGPPGAWGGWPERLTAGKHNKIVFK